MRDSPEAIYAFCREIVDATADLVCAFKPQFAYFASARAEAQLERLLTHLRERHPQVPVILDVLAAAGIATGGAEGHEADDVIGTLAHREDT